MRVLIVDGHPLFRRAVKGLIAGSFPSAVVREAATGVEALHIVEEAHVDVALLDLDLPDFSGITLLRRFKHVRPSLRCLVLGMADDPRYARLAMVHGASAYLAKEAPWLKLYHAVRSVLTCRSAVGLNRHVLSLVPREVPYGPLPLD
jgi:DNA-binding NarL/FixJ family response regulator